MARGMMLAGTPDQVIERIQAYRAAGANHVVLSMQAPYELDQLELFASQVMPAFRTASPALSTAQSVS